MASAGNHIAARAESGKYGTNTMPHLYSSKPLLKVILKTVFLMKLSKKVSNHLQLLDIFPIMFYCTIVNKINLPILLL